MARRTRRFGVRVADADRRLVQLIAGLPIGGHDRAITALTRTANHSFLWMVIAAVLGTRKGRPRRAALRGVATIGVASLLVNAIAKPLAPRRRPAHADLPPGRSLPPGERPTSSSFPSGHAASAAAFATAVAMEHPRAGAGVIPVAALVGYSRVHTGVHWPSDVVVGAAMGVAVARVTRRWWPVRGDEAATVTTKAQVPDLGTGAGLLVLVNPGAGGADGDPADRIRALWPDVTVHYPDEDTDLVAQLDEIVAEARPVAVGVAGGDGSVAAMASVAARSGLPLVVVPAGTLNHFARDIGVPDEGTLADAVRARSGSAIGLGTVEVDGGERRWFINTASIGGYPDMVRLREKWENRWGKWPAAGAALIAVLRSCAPLTLRIDGRPTQVWMLFVGNGRYRPRGLAVARASLAAPVLDVRYVRADTPFSRTRFVTAVLLGALERSRTYVQREPGELALDIDGPPIALATDGEASVDGTRFRFVAHPEVLKVYRPV